MELNEKRQKAINEVNWRMLKKEFDEIETYPKKLAWWEINIPPRSQYIKNVISMPEFQYSGIGAPIVKNLPCAIIVAQFDTIKIDTSGSSDRQEFISILPKPFDSIEKKQFLDWLSVKINLKSSEHFESHYNEIFRNILPINRNEVIENLKNELNLERDEHKNHFDFKYGRESSMYNDPKYLNFGNPNFYYMGIESSIKRIILGYQNNLKEIALDKVIKNLNDKTEYIISDIGIPNLNKIKWLGTPSQFSYLFLELVKKGYIEQPLYRGETSPSRYAELCLNNFDIETTLNSLQTEFKNNSSLTDTYRSKFVIPEKTETTDKRSGNNKKR